MSILINGMEMPSKCIRCPVNVYGRCLVNDDKDVSEATANAVRDKDCPLVPIPPHRLIDREQILDSIRIELAQANAVNDMEDYDSWVRVFDYVRKFPTIIPASEES